MDQKMAQLGVPTKPKPKKKGLLLFWAESIKSAIKFNFKRVYLPYMDLVLGGS